LTPHTVEADRRDDVREFNMVEKVVLSSPLTKKQKPLRKIEKRIRRRIRRRDWDWDWDWDWTELKRTREDVILHQM